MVNLLVVNLLINRKPLMFLHLYFIAIEIFQRCNEHFRFSCIAIESNCLYIMLYGKSECVHVGKFGDN